MKLPLSRLLLGILSVYPGIFFIVSRVFLYYRETDLVRYQRSVDSIISIADAYGTAGESYFIGAMRSMLAVFSLETDQVFACVSTIIAIIFIVSILISLKDKQFDWCLLIQIYALLLWPKTLEIFATNLRSSFAMGLMVLGLTLLTINKHNNRQVVYSAAALCLLAALIHISTLLVLVIFVFSIFFTRNTRVRLAMAAIVYIIPIILYRYIAPYIPDSYTNLKFGDLYSLLPLVLPFTIFVIRKRAYLIDPFGFTSVLLSILSTALMQLSLAGSRIFPYSVLLITIYMVRDSGASKQKLLMGIILSETLLYSLYYWRLL